jgi:tripeptidyl-peptidase-1
MQQTYHVWKHIESGESIVRTTIYSLPGNLHDHIDVIQPTTSFAHLKNFRSNSHWENMNDRKIDELLNSISGPLGEVNGTCNSTITIACIQQLYGTIGYEPSAADRNQIAVTAYLGQFANIADLKLFYANQTPSALNSTFSVISINGDFSF